MTDPTKRSPPISVRFTETERSRLKELSGDTPLSIFIRQRALGDVSEPRARRQEPVKDGDQLGQLLARLGQSRMSSNLNQLAKAANMGSLPVTAETEADLRQACAEVFEMRLLLLKALGIKIIERGTTPLPVVDFFNEAADSSR